MDLSLLTPNAELFNLGWIDHFFKETENFELPKIASDISGIYIFWWVGPKDELDKLSRKILLKGKAIKNRELKENQSLTHVIHEIEYQTSWFPQLENNRYALYVGRSTSIYDRFLLHRYRKTLRDWPVKNKPENYHDFNLHVQLYKPTTSSQFRSGWQSLVRHLTFKESEQLLKENVMFPYLPITSVDAIAKRFYLEDYLIGSLRPWFNLGSERSPLIPLQRGKQKTTTRYRAVVLI